MKENRSLLSGVTNARKPTQELYDSFCDATLPLDSVSAIQHASRCYYCYDAPCVKACPTEINIPGFIHRIAQGNPMGAAQEILNSNIMGGTCARVCPVDTLCEGACVRNKPEQDEAVSIGRLQRFATDTFFKAYESNPKTAPKFFLRKPATGKRVAVVGAGPAGLACAHVLAREGHTVSVFDAKPKAGGLNEYGIAAYKMAHDWSAREVQYLLSIGGIGIHTQQALGKNLKLSELRSQYDSVFLALGLGGTNQLGINHEDAEGVWDAIHYIEKIRQAQDLATLPVGRKVLVIGGGNTAIDISVQIKKLGASQVTLLYRRGFDQMSASPDEREFAKSQGVSIQTWVKPVEILQNANHVSGLKVEYTLESNGKLQGSGVFETFEADQIFKAIGQKFNASLKSALAAESVEFQGEKIRINSNYETSVPGVYAGGEASCHTEPGAQDLTVWAAREGQKAARVIHERLTPRRNHG